MFKGTHFWFVVNEPYVYTEKKTKNRYISISDLLIYMYFVSHLNQF